MGDEEEGEGGSADVCEVATWRSGPRGLGIYLVCVTQFVWVEQTPILGFCVPQSENSQCPQKGRRRVTTKLILHVYHHHTSYFHLTKFLG